MRSCDTELLTDDGTVEQLAVYITICLGLSGDMPQCRGELYLLYPPLSARPLPTPVFCLGVQEKVDEEACKNMCCCQVFTLYKVFILFMSSNQFILLGFWFSF